VVAAGMVLIAVTTLLLHTAFATAWSNHCDPGNVRFNLMQNDPISNFQAGGLVMRWENPGPDNSWLCTGATLSYSYIGGNGDTVLAEANAAMQAAGWTETKLTSVPSDGWSFWDKRRTACPSPASCTKTSRGSRSTCKWTRFIWGTQVGNRNPASMGNTGPRRRFRHVSLNGP
jgi:hypothetical protein